MPRLLPKTFSENLNSCIDDLHSYLRFSLFKRALKGIFFLPYISDSNLLRLISWAKKLDRAKEYTSQLEAVERYFKANHPSIRLARRLFKKSRKCREKLAINFFYNATFVGRSKRIRFAKKHNTTTPFFFVISPTMRCNLKCVGCYAAQYKKKADLPCQILDRIFREAKKTGIYFITVSGGEPFIRKDLLRLFRKHNDIYFQVFTNGTLIDRKLARNLANLGNIAPVISIEGLEEETEQRRGKGIFNKVIEAMDNLERAGVIFGFSAMPTSRNWQIIASDRFYEFLIDQGCSFGWLFQYIPIGRDPDLELMMTPEQRLAIRKKVREIRNKHPIFIADFWNDGDYVQGCLAAARDEHGYFHINTNGDIEPCVFVHFAQDNIKKIYARGGHLWDAWNSKFFNEIRAGQPWNKDHRMPCMIIDNPQGLRKAIFGCPRVYPTEKEAEKLVKDKKITGYLDNYSSSLKKILSSIERS
jgi:MoaA/NifB/PqqE/SkfB family radical SAM enzyme